MTADDVTDVPDDADGLRSAARRFSTAADGVLDAATNASRSWSGLPAVFSSNALQPALTPLMDPALQKAQQMQVAAHEFLRVATRAADSIDDLAHEHDRLVRQIAQFHASAPGQVAAAAAEQAASGDLLGAVGTVVTNWQQVPELVGEELGLRMKVRAHNDNVTATLSGIATQLDGISPSTVDAHPVHTAAHVSGAGGGGDHNWFERAWDTAKAAVGVGGAVIGAEAAAAWPHMQDAAAVAGNVFASLGNAMVDHPDEMLELLGGIATMVGGAAMEGGGVVLDITGVGAIAGVPLNISGAAVMTAGAGLAATGATQLGVHAMTDDRVSPNQTDHVQRWREKNEQYEGRDKKGRYRSEDNDKARADSADKQQRGLDDYEEETGITPNPKEVVARVDSVGHTRKFDGLAEKPDGTYEGVEVKSGTATKSTSQEEFDDAVSYDNPATATLDGKKILITSTRLINVK
ncbi:MULTISPECIES: hypothetical protein [unclassified Curtobacterium]|uniref:hypothetical protein n=2 Tax=Curtobacterium TaxID=2034 RepID=UPI000DB2D266|nr:MULTISPECIES: hypothetical protein [unclassified Curtobacterium]PZE25668.1 hypothetical protein DEI86_10240 [Curtobacterium sp. MCBD17_028]PZF57151.1 hypothetical protein DEI92_13375 [Curtobacterium sp. MCBD17_034]